MGACKITGCLAVATGVIYLVATDDTKFTLDACTRHRDLIEGPARPMSIGFTVDDTAAKIAQVRREWRQAHPRVGDKKE